MTFTYLSLGAGVQSTALLAMSSLGLNNCPKADIAVFADTQAEPAYVYEHLERLKAISSIPIHVVTAGNLWLNNIGKSRSTIPWFTAKDGRTGIALRKCTYDYKITPILRFVRQHLGYQPRQRVKHSVNCLVGISVDEMQRVKPSQEKWVTRIHPLINADFRRSDCTKLLESVGWPVPMKSSCVFCPYHDDAEWLRLRDHFPKEFQRAVEFDRLARDQSAAGLISPVFLHRSLVPLDKVQFKEPKETPLFDSFTPECEGMCGV